MAEPPATKKILFNFSFLLLVCFTFVIGRSHSASCIDFGICHIMLLKLLFLDQLLPFRNFTNQLTVKENGYSECSSKLTFMNAIARYKTQYTLY